MKDSNTYFDRFGWSLQERDPAFINALMPVWSWLYRHYFQVTTSGWEQIPTQGKMLLVGSHNGGLATPDLPMFMYDWFRHFGIERRVYGLMHPHVWKVYPHMAWFAAKAGAIVAHPRMAMAAFEQGDSVLVYPGGGQDVFRPYYLRHKIHLAGRQGFIKLALRENVPIVPFISYGAHNTLLVLADYYEQMKQLHELGMPWLFNLDPEVFPIYLGLPWGLAIGPLPNIPWPHPIHTRVCPPILFEFYGREAAKNRDYVEQCYHQVHEHMQKHLNLLVKDVEGRKNQTQI